MKLAFQAVDSAGAAPFLIAHFRIKKKAEWALHPFSLVPMHLLLRLTFIALVAAVSAWVGVFAGLSGGGAAAGALGGAAFGHWIWQLVLEKPLQAAQAKICELEESNSVLLSFVNDAPVVMAMKDDQGQYLRCNAEFERMHGVTRSDIRGKHDLELGLVQADVAQRIRDLDQRVIETGLPATYQVAINSCGAPRLMEAIKFPLRDSAQALVGIGIIATDVSDRKVLADKFESVFHVSPDWIVITRLADGVVIDANPGFEVLSGHTREAAMGRSIVLLNIWAHPEQRTTLVGALLRDGHIDNAVVQMRRKDGVLRDFVVNAALISLDGQTHSHAVWLARDVTDSHEAERALIESETRFSSLFDLSPLPTSYSFDTDDYTTNYRNAAFFDTFGYSKETDAAKSTLELGFWVHPEDAKKARRIRLEGQPVDRWIVEVRHADGRHLWVSIFGRFIVEPTRTIVVTTLFDITEHKHAQLEIESLNTRLEDRVLQRTEQLQVANADLSRALITIEQTRDSLVQSEKLASLGALVAGVAHELNTPIGNGLTVASAMEEKVRSFAVAAQAPMQRSTLLTFIEESRLASELLVRSLTRAATLVSGFKQVAVDQTSSQRRKFDLRVLLDEVIMTMSPATRRAKCSIVLSVEPVYELDSFPGPLIQVMTNLINNALVHAFAPGTNACIEITAHTDEADYISIRVQDNGRGIEPAHVKHLYDPFFTTRLGQGSSGLGLHIVHNIVTGALGGRIEVHTALGQGTGFVIDLPLTAPRAANEPLPGRLPT